MYLSFAFSAKSYGNRSENESILELFYSKTLHLKVKQVKKLTKNLQYIQLSPKKAN